MPRSSPVSEMESEARKMHILLLIAALVPSSEEFMAPRDLHELSLCLPLEFLPFNLPRRLFVRKIWRKIAQEDQAYETVKEAGVSIELNNL